MKPIEKSTEIRYAICLENGGYDLDLIPLKVYAVLPPRPNETDLEYIRVIDETGEDYLYPAEYFIPVELSEKDEEGIRRVLAERGS
jgi:hypothetical protein